MTTRSMTKKEEEDADWEAWLSYETMVSTYAEDFVECVICKAQTLNKLDYDYDDDIGFHCCQKPNCLRQFWRE